MQIVNTVREMQRLAESLRAEGKKIGVVPTMGYLHAGHVSLIKTARAVSDIVITTIFVNPTQFGPGEDFERYPRDFAGDQKLASEAGADIIFSPAKDEIYTPGFATHVEVEDVSKILEGKFRPTHFRGVTTIVVKLLNITKPHVAVFGQKDAQQAFLIRKMAADLNFDVSIMIAPIVREPDGLALSSRNGYLSPDERQRATALHKSLRRAELLMSQGERSADRLHNEMEKILIEANPTQVDYIAFVNPESFKETGTPTPPAVLVALAVRFGATRLIDNMIMKIA
ncbi:MAG: pantoate--beta-alanine ligase [Ignavibacteriales bacterium]|nr:pantoate--beta-alanine ligase [Ignavibacteriales bacterium]